MEAALLIDARQTLAEGIVWSPAERALWWTDITGARLWHWRAADGQLRSWAMPERLASFALCDDARWLLLALASRLAFFDPQRGDLHPICSVRGEPGTRLNDGRCDRFGNFVFGSQDEAERPARRGRYYRLNRDLTLIELDLPRVDISNSVAFSPDGARMYFTDTPSHVIQCADYRASGEIANRRVFARLGPGEGQPDGAIVDADGGLWSAHWGAGQAVRYNPDGRISARVHIGAPHVTCMAFGGPRLDTLYVTTSREALAPGETRYPHAGGIFAAVPGYRGLPPARFGGRPHRK
ncbi:SMP-30/gluconolactonase/LRE family protein [Chitinasiproducens palmae]|uniref:L-arabinonolactonase n=1 Tax=Chitinasiproducens palmae TaxID=1770053 RepID=A0A1H2PKB6_9BURK|nr:SMP-30/gluconolactonase/LRE family protein [Chitinasiproducens palmae]SDV46360.1 L-arabinonolactonase [Chitinasiproducens palmae]